MQYRLNINWSENLFYIVELSESKSKPACKPTGSNSSFSFIM